jgi:hypothetical protein
MNSCKTETGLDVGHAKNDYDGGKTDLCIIDVHVDLHLDVTKGYYRFMGNWCNLIYDDVYGSNDCGTIPYNLIVLSLFYNDTLGSMTKTWRKLAEKLIHWN